MSKGQPGKGIRIALCSSFRERGLEKNAARIVVRESGKESKIKRYQEQTEPNHFASLSGNRGAAAADERKACGLGGAWEGQTVLWQKQLLTKK